MDEEYVDFLDIFITFFGAEDQQDAALAVTELFAYLYQSRVQIWNFNAVSLDFP